MNEVKITKEGYLEKEGAKGVKTFKKRYFRLKGTLLYYSKGRESTSMIDSIDVSHARSIERETKEKLVFVVDDPTRRAFRLRGENIEVVESWLEALRSVCLIYSAEKQLKNLKFQVESLTTESNTLKETLHSREQQFQDLSNLNNTYATKISTLEKDLSEQVRVNQQILLNIKSSNESSEVRSMITDVSTSIQSLLSNRPLNDASDLNKILDDKNEEIQKRDSLIVELRDRISTLTESGSNSTKIIHQKNDDVVLDKENRIAELETQIKELTTQSLISSRKDDSIVDESALEALTVENQKLKADLDKANESNSKSICEIGELRKDVTRLSEEVAAVNGKSDVDLAIIDSLKKENERLSSEVKSMSGVIESMKNQDKSKDGSIDRYKREIQESEEQKNQLLSQLKLLEESKAQLEKSSEEQQQTIITLEAEKSFISGSETLLKDELDRQKVDALSYQQGLAARDEKIKQLEEELDNQKADTALTQNDIALKADRILKLEEELTVIRNLHAEVLSNAENDKLKLVELNETNNQLNGKLNEFQESLDTLKQDNVKLTLDLSKAKDQLNQTKHEKESLLASLEQNNVLDQLNVELNTYKNTVEELRDINTKLQVDLTHLKENMDLLVAEKESLLSSLANKEKLMENMVENSFIEQLKSEVESLKNSIETSNQDSSNIQSELSNLQELYKNIQLEKDSLSVSLTEVKSVEIELQTAVEDLKKERDSLNNELANQKECYNALANENTSLANSVQVLDKLQSDFNEMKTANENLQEQNSSLEQELATEKSRLEVVSSEKDRLLVSASDISQLVQVETDKNQAYLRTIEQLENDKSSLNNEVQKLNIELDQIKVTLEQSKKEAQEFRSEQIASELSEKEAMVEQIATLKANNMVLQEENSKMNSEMALNAEMSTKIKTLEEEKSNLILKVETLNLEVKEMKETLLSIEEQKASTNSENRIQLEQISTLHKELEALKQENNTLKSALEKEKSESSSTNSVEPIREEENLRYKTEIDLLKTQLSGLEDSLQELRIMNTDYEQQISDLSNEKAHLESRVVEIQSAEVSINDVPERTLPKELFSEALDMDKRVELLSSTIRDLFDENKAKSLEIVQLSEINNVVLERNISLEKQIANMENEVEMKDKYITGLNNQLSMYKRDLDNKKIPDVIREISSELEKARMTSQSHTTHIGFLERKIEQLLIDKASEISQKKKIIDMYRLDCFKSQDRLAKVCLSFLKGSTENLADFSQDYMDLRRKYFDLTFTVLKQTNRSLKDLNPQEVWEKCTYGHYSYFRDVILNEADN